MLYTPVELADELECSVKLIQQAIDMGCPYRANSRRDRQGYVIGDEFAIWYREITKRRKYPLGRNEAYCLKCKIPVPLEVGEVTPMRDGVERVSGICPRCGKTINRFRRAE